MNTIYLIEILDKSDGEWVPMYTPSYTLEEAEKKCKRKAATFGIDRVRISRWCPTWEPRNTQMKLRPTPEV